jgi:plastocyanin
MSSLRLSLLTIVSILLIACGGGSSSSTPTTPTPTPTPAPATGSTPVSIPMNARTLGPSAFNPSPLTISVGTTVRWTNDDTIAHDSTSNTNVWASGNMNPGAHFDFTFQAAGTYPYHCTIHSGMTGTVVVQ